MTDIKPTNLLVNLLLIVIIGGALSYLLSMVLTPVIDGAGIWGDVVLFGFITVLWIALLTILKGKLLKLGFEMTVFTLVGVGLIGTILTTISPQVAPFILSVDFTLTGLGLALPYIAISRIVAKKIGF